MLIQNGTIEFKSKTGGGIDLETGYPSKPSSENWGEKIPCNIQHTKMNLLAQAIGGEHFKSHSYEIYVDEDTEVTSEEVRLKDINGNEIGEFSIISKQPLEAVAMIKILV